MALCDIQPVAACRHPWQWRGFLALERTRLVLQKASPGSRQEMSPSDRLHLPQVARQRQAALFACLANHPQAVAATKTARTEPDHVAHRDWLRSQHLRSSTRRIPFSLPAVESGCLCLPRARSPRMQKAESETGVRGKKNTDAYFNNTYL